MLNLCFRSYSAFLAGAAAVVAEPLRLVGMNAIAIYVLAEAAPSAIPRLSPNLIDALLRPNML